MEHTLHFNYSIGDKVILKEMPSYRYRSYDAWKHEFKPKEYEISGLGWVLDDEGYHTYYRLYAYCDDYLTYHNRITDLDDLLKPSGEVHPQDIEIDLSDGNGDEIKIGDNIIAYVCKASDSEEVNLDFTFAGEGTVVHMESFYDGRKHLEGDWSVSGGGVEVFYKRRFICHKRNGSEYKGGRREGCIESYFIGSCYKKLPDNYVEDYVNSCIKNKFNPCSEPYEYDDWDLWLKHFGIFDEVKKLYKEKIEEKNVKSVRKPSTKKSVKKNDKLSKLVGELTDKEKEELLKMLQK